MPAPFSAIGTPASGVEAAATASSFHAQRQQYGGNIVERINNIFSWRSRTDGLLGIPSSRKAGRALQRAALGALVALLGAFLGAYPLLRLGYLGPIPDGYALETGFAIVTGLLATVSFLLETRP